MSVTTTGQAFLEPFSGFRQPTPLFALIGRTDSTGDATGGTNTITYTLSADILWVLRQYWLSNNTSLADPWSVEFTTELEGLMGRSHLTAAQNPSGGVEDWPRMLIRSATAPTLIFRIANTNGINARTGFRCFGFPKTALRDFSIAELLGFVI